MHGKPLRDRKAKSLLFRLQLPKVIAQLEGACLEASEREWGEHERKRAEEIAVALSEACRIEGLREPAIVARSLGSLMRLSGVQILPVEAALREKVTELLISLRNTGQKIWTGSG